MENPLNIYFLVCLFVASVVEAIQKETLIDMDA
jgi:hypothetical protein